MQWFIDQFRSNWIISDWTRKVKYPKAPQTHARFTDLVIKTRHGVLDVVWWGEWSAAFYRPLPDNEHMGIGSNLNASGTILTEVWGFLFYREAVLSCDLLPLTRWADTVRRPTFNNFIQRKRLAPHHTSFKISKNLRRVNWSHYSFTALWPRLVIYVSAKNTYNYFDSLYLWMEKCSGTTLQIGNPGRIPDFQLATERPTADHLTIC